MALNESETGTPPPTPEAPPRSLVHHHPVMRGLWLSLGIFFVLLGIIGALLPIMPTTIFLILAAGCFARSSPRLESWLMDHRHFGPPLRAWREQKAMSRAAKAMACGGMAMGFTMFVLLAHPHLLPACLVALPLLACAAYVLTRPAPRRRAPRL